MKKIVAYFILLFSLVVCCSCAISKKVFNEGIYYSNNLNNDKYSKGKIEIKLINKYYFDKQEDLNVVKDHTNDYYIFRLYLFDDEKNEYVLFDIFNIVNSIEPEFFKGNLFYFKNNEILSMTIRIYVENNNIRLFNDDGVNEGRYTDFILHKEFQQLKLLKSYTFSTSIPKFDINNKGEHVPNNLYDLKSIPEELLYSDNKNGTDTFYFINDIMVLRSFVDKYSEECDTSYGSEDLYQGLGDYLIIAVLRINLATNAYSYVKYMNFELKDNTIYLSRKYINVDDMQSENTIINCLDLIYIPKDILSINLSNENKYTWMITEIK